MCLAGLLFYMNKKGVDEAMNNRDLASYLESIIIHCEKCDSIAEIIEILKRLKNELK